MRQKLHLSPSSNSPSQLSDPLIDVFLYLVLGMAVDLLDLGFELLALALQFGNLFLGQLVPLFLDRARKLFPVIFDMIPNS